MACTSASLSLSSPVSPRVFSSSQLSPSTNSSLSNIPSVSVWRSKRFSSIVVRAKAKAKDVAEATLTGVVFEPFVEVQSQLTKVPSDSEKSLARQNYASSSEAGINEQINVEYNISYIYHALYAYFDRDTVALPGFAAYFKAASDEEREHAEKLMAYQNKRGGRVKLQTIVMPQTMEFDHPEKGDALYAMELTLSLEKLVNEKLLALHKIAVENDDPQLSDFLEGHFLNEQVDAIKKVSDYVATLRRIGKGHAVYHFDKELQAVH